MQFFRKPWIGYLDSYLFLLLLKMIVYMSLFYRKYLAFIKLHIIDMRKICKSFSVYLQKGKIHKSLRISLLLARSHVLALSLLLPLSATSQIQKLEETLISAKL